MVSKIRWPSSSLNGRLRQLVGMGASDAAGPLATETIAAGRLLGGLFRGGDLLAERSQHLGHFVARHVVAVLVGNRITRLQDLDGLLAAIQLQTGTSRAVDRPWRTAG